MKSFFMSLTLLLSSSLWAMSGEQKSQILLKEWEVLRQHVETLSPDYTVGGLYLAKEYEGTTLLWKISNDPSDNEVIRFYSERSAPEQDFGVTYYKSHAIIPGRVVLRRFYGPDRTGWRNDTLDFISAEYIGSQGRTAPFLSERDQDFMRDWNLTEFND